MRRWKPTPFCWSASSGSSEIGQELDHPGIVKTYDGEERSRLYMVIEWVEGRLLRSILNQESRLPIDRAVQPHPVRSATHWTTCTSTAWCTAT